MRTILLILLSLPTAWGTVWAEAQAEIETAYIIDVGTLVLREAPKDAAKPVAELGTGTALQVLEHDGDFARVQTGDGMQGWLPAARLAAEPPARLLVEYLGPRQREALRERVLVEHQLILAEAQLAAERERVDAARELQAADDNKASGEAQAEEQSAADSASEDGTAGPDADAAADADADADAAVDADAASRAPTAPEPVVDPALAAAQANVQRLRDRLAEWEQATAPASDPERRALEAELERLRADSLGLRARIASAYAVLDGQGVPDARTLARVAPGVPVWYWGVLAAAFIVGILGGAGWLDWRHRRRHGGFRI